MKNHLVDLGAGALAGVVCFCLGFIATLFSSDVRAYLVTSGILIAVSVFIYARSRLMGAIAWFIVGAVFVFLAIFASALWISFSRWQPFL